MKSIRFLCVTLIMLALTTVASYAQSDTASRLFFMNTWFLKTDFNAEQQAALLKKLDQPRMSVLIFDEQRWKTYPQTIKTLREQGIDVVAVYTNISIDSGKCSERLIKLIEFLKGSDTFVWMALTSKKFKPSDPQGDSLAVSMLQEAAELAQKSGIKISVYTHFNFWAERISDTIRVLQKVDRTNVKGTFNLYHWLKVEGPDNLKQLAQKSVPYLNCITINGSQPNAKELSVDDGILVLGEGEYNVKTFVEVFLDAGFNGDIGLQGYSIGGDIPAKMEQSLNVWRSYWK